jgi:hypothetical protein
MRPPRSVWLACVALASLAASPAHEPRQVLPWIKDDYAKALQEARARKLPIFIEAWAPW